MPEDFRVPCLQSAPADHDDVGTANAADDPAPAAQTTPAANAEPAEEKHAYDLPELNYDEITRAELVRGDDNILKIVEMLHLPDCSKTLQAMRALSQGNDGKLNKIFIDHVPHVVKFYKTGINVQYVTFQQTLLVQRDSPEAKRHPGYEAVYFVAVPVGYVKHQNRIGLVFPFVVPPRDEEKRGITVEDRAQVRVQMEFLHWLGFCHLDITARNILQGRNGKCYLLDYDCVCAIGRCPLGPVPPESSKSIMQRNPAEVLDDLHLWRLLQGTYFKGLPEEEIAVDESKICMCGLSVA